MKPTKEMIIKTRELIAQADRDIQEIIKENDFYVKEIQKRDKRESKHHASTWPDVSHTIDWVIKKIKPS
ncbi:MAG: hypothetical protein GY864_14490 [Desulfobacterales bacterium]|nr:hypothetical protein [Desulfobacterales bacterium]